MRNPSPLRYPGGKSSLTHLLSGVRQINQLGYRSTAEPFAGGAGAALSLLYREDTHEIYINDIDKAIHDFWWTLVNRPKPFFALLRSTRVNISEWRRQKDIYRQQTRVSRLRKGFSAFYLNRCNRSGIIMNGGPIGGLRQKGEWKINARFNKSNLLERCEKVAEYSKRIKVSQIDAINFINQHDHDSMFFFVDPPYYKKGQTLYLNKLNHTYHENLANQLHSLQQAAWVLTYDDCIEIRKMYSGWANIRAFKLRYVASERRKGKELLITPKWMQIPKVQGSAAINW